MTLSEVSTALQLSVSPTIVISACGLLLLSMTNRLGRAIDRSRVLARERPGATVEFRKSIDRQLSIIRSRCRLIRAGILSVSVCIFLTVLLVALLFLLATVRFDAPWVIAVVFIASMGSLLISVSYFIRDIFQSLAAVETEIAHSLGEG
jgi:hypothetical protein